MLTWDYEPILQGNKGRIKASFFAHSPSHFSKSFYVKFSNGDLEYLTVKGNVEYIPSNPPPAF